MNNHQIHVINGAHISSSGQISLMKNSQFIRRNKDVHLQRSSFCSLLRPRALACIFPEDLCMAAGNHGLLDIHPVNEQLTDCPAIAISCDSADAHPLIDQQSAEVIFRSDCWSWFCIVPLQLRCIDACQPDPFA